ASKRSYPEQLPAITYDVTDVVRKVMSDGAVRFHGDRYYISKAFEGEDVALRPSQEDGVWDVFFCHERVAAVRRRDSLA
ncbi:MAG TPA: IS481 family transposase, partial [Thermoanaerobaculia bacterium]|nr:IS481 family transposase [Thermoanaerobaculia bacterium]